MIIIGLAALYILSPIRPLVWQPDANAGLNNMYQKNNALDIVRVVGTSTLLAPEDVFISADGVAYTGLGNGDVVSFPIQNPDEITVIANTGGRPLGVRLDADGNLIVSDAIKGLLSITPDGDIEVLVSEHEGKRLMLIDHHEIAGNGDIYFSNASAKYDINTYILDFIEASATGGVYRYSPSTGETQRLMSNLFFANGITLGPNDEYLLVAETGKARILKFQLTGPNRGESTIFANNLPAMPDNLSFNGNDTFWAGMVSLRDSRIETLSAYPVIRRIMGALPLEWFEALASSSYGFVLGFDLDGKVVANYQTHDRYSAITSAYQHKDMLYLGSLTTSGVAIMPIEVKSSQR